MLIADSHEFIELYRGDKDVRLGIEMTRLQDDLRYVSFAPDAVSPVERGLLGKKKLTTDDLPDLPDAMEVRLLPSAAVRFAHKEVGGVMSLMPALSRELRHLRPDAILENPYTWLTPRSYSTHSAARRLGVPVVYYDPGDDVPVGLKQRLLLPFERPVVLDAAAIITYNEVGRRRFREKYGYPDERIFVIPKPVDIGRWRRPGLRDGVRAALGIPPHVFVVAHSGRLTRFRGSAMLAETAAAAVGNSRFADTVFLFIGDTMGSDVDRSLYEGPNTIVTGMVPNDRMPGMLAAADLVVFPDLATKAGFTTAVAETMAAARPIMIGARPGDGAVPLTDGVDALFVEPGSVMALLETIASIAENSPLAHSLGESVGRLASELMDYPRVAQAYLDILESVVTHERPA